MRRAAPPQPGPNRCDEPRRAAPHQFKSVQQINSTKEITVDWIKYEIELRGLTPLLGGMPKTEDLIRAQMSSKEIRLRAKVLSRDPEKIIAENLISMGIEEGIETICDEEKLSCGFRCTPEGLLAIGSHQLPSMLIDAATTLQYSRKHRGLKDLLTRGLVVEPFPMIVILSTNHTVTSPTETLEWGSQVRDRMGSRAILRRYDSIDPWEVSCTIRFPNTAILTQAIWSDLWEMGGHQGLGSARPRGFGRFDAKWEKTRQES